jgi:hypothetical protein
MFLLSPSTQMPGQSFKRGHNASRLSAGTGVECQPSSQLARPLPNRALPIRRYQQQQQQQRLLRCGITTFKNDFYPERKVSSLLFEISQV